MTTDEFDWQPTWYVPSSLRFPKDRPPPRRKYFCAYEGRGIYFGLVNLLIHALEDVPASPDSNPGIFQIDEDGTETKLYYWDKDRWVKVKKDA